MSYVEMQAGSITKIEFPEGLTFEEKIAHIWDNIMHCEPDDVGIGWVDWRSGNKRVFYFRDEFWCATIKVDASDIEDIKLIYEADGQLNFVVHYYNGVTCFDEMLQRALAEYLEAKQC